MRKIFLFALVIFIVNCGQSKEVNIKVEGIEKGTEFSIFKGREMVLSGVISENIILDFSEKDKSEFPNSYILSVKGFGYQNFIVDLGDDVTISFNSENKSFTVKSNIENKKEEFISKNSELLELRNSKKEKTKILGDIYAQYLQCAQYLQNKENKESKEYKENKKKLEELEKEYEQNILDKIEISNKYIDIVYDIITKSQTKNIEYLFVYIDGFLDTDYKDNMEKLDISINLFEEYRKLFDKKFINEQLEYFNSSKDILIKKQKVSQGSDFVDIEALGLDRKTTIKLSDIVSKHKVVLLKFWASWCGPCIRSLPSILELTKKYGNKGFQVFAVSLDKEDGENKWKEAIEKHGLQSWIHCSELKFWNGENHKKYGVTGIPAEFLIIDGKISSNNKTSINDKDKMIKEAYSKK